MTHPCPPCSGDCHQGRRCPAGNRPPARALLLVAALVAIALLA